MVQRRPVTVRHGRRDAPTPGQAQCGATGRPGPTRIHRYEAVSESVIQAAGELGLEECGRLREALWPELGLPSARPVVVDLRQVHHADEHLWAVLVAARHISERPFVVRLEPGSQPEQIGRLLGAAALLPRPHKLDEQTPAAQAGTGKAGIVESIMAAKGRRSVRKQMLVSLLVAIPAGLLLLWLALFLVYRAVRVPPAVRIPVTAPMPGAPHRPPSAV